MSVDLLAFLIQDLTYYRTEAGMGFQGIPRITLLYLRACLHGTFFLRDHNHGALGFNSAVNSPHRKKGRQTLPHEARGSL